MVWRSPEPSWWPIASLVSLMCTHRWTRPTQWTNVAHRVVLRKGSSRLLFFPHAPFSPFSHFHSFSFFHLSPAASASSPSLFFLLVTPFPYFIGIYLSRDVSSFYPYFFSLHSYVAAYFFALLSLIVPNAPSLSSPFFISFVYDIAASFCPPPVVRTFSAFKSMSFYQCSSCSSGREEEKDFGLSCVVDFFLFVPFLNKLNVIIFDLFARSFRLVKTIWEIWRGYERNERYDNEIRVFGNRGAIIIIPVKKY